jgi:tetratricopeptide (TPR) repeat protein
LITPLYLRDAALLALCQGFGQAIEESLGRFDHERALELASEWLLRLNGNKDDAGLPDQKAAIRLWRAELLVQLQRWDQASEELDGILCRRPELRDTTLLIRSLILSAQVHGVYGEQEQAQHALRSSAELDVEGRFRAEWQLEKARLLVRSGELDEALELLAPDSQAGEEHWIERGRVLFRLQRFSEADEAWLRVAEQGSGTRFQAEALRLLGLLCRELSRPQQALKFLEQALRAFWRLQMWVGVTKTYGGLGQVCSDLGKWTEALHFTHKAERLSRRLGAESELAVVYGRLGNLCMKLQDFPRAIRFHQLDVEICHRFGNYRALAYALTNLAFSYRAQGDCEKASELLSDSLERFLQLGERGPMLRVRIERGRTLIERNLLEEAANDLQAATWMLGQGTAAADSAQIYVLMARLERLRNHYEEADTHLQFAYEMLQDVARDAPVRCEALREEGYLHLARGALDRAAQAFAEATKQAQRGDQQTVWVECLEQLDRLDELHGSDTVLEGLQRSAWDSFEAAAATV